jgi:hypothetical protein
MPIPRRILMRYAKVEVSTIGYAITIITDINSARDTGIDETNSYEIWAETKSEVTWLVAKLNLIEIY